MKLNQIVWPVYKLGNKPPIVENGTTYFHSEYLEALEVGEDMSDDDLSESDDFTQETRYQISHIVKVVDDLSLPGDTVGKRRLHIPKDHIAPIKYAVYFLGDFLKIAKAGVWFIDSSGRAFTYKKRTRAKLKCFKISQIIPGGTTGAIIEVKGVVQRFKVLYYPEDDMLYAGLLLYNKGYVLYGLYRDYFIATHRVV